MTRSRQFLGLLKPAQPIALIPGTWVIVLLSASTMAVSLMLFWTGLLVAPRTWGFAAAIGCMASLVLVRTLVHIPASAAHEGLRDFTEDLFGFVTISLLGVLASYPAAAATTGFSDSTLSSVDTLLHFNWVWWYREVADHRWLQLLLELAYSAIYISPVLVLGFFSMIGQRARSRQFLVTFWLGVVMTLLLFPLFPAEGPLAYLWRGPIPYMPISALYQEQLIPALRMHQLTDIDLGALRGLVCAPSFHTVSAIIYIAAAWPVARLRWPILSLNLAMLVATPIEGTHYLSDMLAGLVVGLVAIWLGKLVQQMARPNVQNCADEHLQLA